MTMTKVMRTISFQCPLRHLASWSMKRRLFCLIIFFSWWKSGNIPVGILFGARARYHTLSYAAYSWLGYRQLQHVCLPLGLLGKKNYIPLHKVSKETWPIVFIFTVFDLPVLILSFLISNDHVPAFYKVITRTGALGRA